MRFNHGIDDEQKMLNYLYRIDPSVRLPRNSSLVDNQSTQCESESKRARETTYYCLMEALPSRSLKCLQVDRGAPSQATRGEYGWILSILRFLFKHQMIPLPASSHCFLLDSQLQTITSTEPSHLCYLLHDFF